jgi:hypothetical protein
LGAIKVSQTAKIIRAMLKGWQSTSSLIHCGGGNTPLTRLSKWRKQNFEYITKDHYPTVAYRTHGKLYEEKTREIERRNAEGEKVRFLERRLVAVK